MLVNRVGFDRFVHVQANAFAECNDRSRCDQTTILSGASTVHICVCNHQAVQIEMKHYLTKTKKTVGTAKKPHQPEIIL